MEHILEITGTVTGILYLWLEYRASIYLWIAGIIMPAVYIFVYYDAGLYADFGINIYYLGAAIYGWMMWKYRAVLRRTILKRKDAPQRGENNRTEEQKQELSITYMPTRYLLPLTAVFTAAFLGIAWILINFTDSNVPWLDRTEHRRHVDAGTEICRTMVGMDCGRCRQRRTVHLQRT